MKDQDRGGKGPDGLSSLALRLLAMTFMLCDHLWATLLPGNPWMTWVGRLAFPIFAFLLAEGFRRTRSRKDYLKRLLLLAVLSEVPFDLMCEGTPVFPFHQNVIWTLLLGLLCIWGMERAGRSGSPWRTATAVAGLSLAGWLAGTVLMVDYHGAGVLTVILFHLLPGERWRDRLGQLAGLWWINCVLLGGLHLPVTVGSLTLEFPQQGFALLALPLIWLYRGRQGPHGRAVRLACYAFYPLHMLLLAGAARLL